MLALHSPIRFSHLSLTGHGRLMLIIGPEFIRYVQFKDHRRMHRELRVTKIFFMTPVRRISGEASQ